MKKLAIILIVFIFFSCEQNKKPKPKLTLTNTNATNLKYAKGFTITQNDNYTILEVTQPWPNATKTYKYALISKENAAKTSFMKDEYDGIIIKPIEKLVVMSTTNIPSLEYLGVDNTLVGFPNTQYISSKKTRTRVKNGYIKDLNNDLDINMERLIDLQPDLVIGFSVNGNNKILEQIEKYGIPVAIDGAWTEQHPLGRAEWIKCIAAFFDKSKVADSIFNTIETNYIDAKEMALKTKEKPLVMSGSMFKDIWNIPGGKSFVAKYLEDAHTNYLWKDNDNNGSLQLNFENVLDKAQNADLWIGAGSFHTKQQMLESHKGYSYFDAYKNNTIYTYTKKTGPTGGLLYFELGSLRPDLILKDIINIAHPNTLTDYDNYFFKQLN